MRALLLHHAEAESPAVDPQRPLTAAGHEHAARLAERARELGFAPAAIWHSGKLRARQTAEYFLRRCNPSAEFRLVRGLRPEDPADWIRHELEAESRDVLVAGHMPHISALAASLGAAAGVPLHGFVLFERAETGWSVLTAVDPLRMG